jgi:hypothetical protein
MVPIDPQFRLIQKTKRQNRALADTAIAQPFHVEGILFRARKMERRVIPVSQAKRETTMATEPARDSGCESKFPH